MNRTSLVSRALVLSAAATLTGCASHQPSEEPLLSHAEVAAVHRAASHDVMLFAAADVTGATMVRDWDSDELASDALMLRTQGGFLAGDVLGTMTLRTPNVQSLAAAADDE